MDLLLITEYLNKNANHPYLKWNVKNLNIFKHCTKLEFSTVMYWQRGSNKYEGDINNQTRQCLYYFLWKYSTIELRDCMNNTYELQENIEQGGAVYLYLILSEIFQMTTDVVTDFNTIFTNFKDWSLSKIQGENISVINKQLEYVAVSLNEVDSIPEEAPLDVLNGLSFWSCGYFKNNFQFQETEERISNIHKKHKGGNKTLDQVKVNIQESNGIYNSLCTSVKWYVINRGGHAKYLWNFEVNHGVNCFNK